LGIVEEPKGKPKAHSALPCTIGGQEFLLDARGDAYLKNPRVLVENVDGGRKKIRIHASSEKEAEFLLKQLGKSFPKINDSNFERSPSNFEPNSLMQLSLQVGGGLVFNALLKVAIGFAVSRGISPSDIRPAIEGLMSGVDFGFVSTLKERLTKSLEDQSFHHTVILDANPTSGLLVVFMELFGCAHYLVVLSASYSGSQIHYSYSIDPVSGKENSCKSSVTLERDQLAQLFSPDEFSDEFMDCVKYGLAAGMYYQKRGREISDVVEGAISHLRELGFDGLNSENLHIFTAYITDNYFKKKIRPKS
jgi:hypothetical protein